MKSRVLMVPFALPSIGPTSTETLQAFDDFEEALKNGEYTSAIGWVIRQKLELLQHGKKFVSSMKAALQSKFGTKVRCCTSWAVCLFFVNQVLYISN